MTDVRLPNGSFITDVPDGTPDEVVWGNAITIGIATPEDFVVLDYMSVQEWLRPAVTAKG